MGLSAYIRPIVRIRPDSVHINDPNQIDQVQGTATGRCGKSKLNYNMMTSPGAFIMTPESDLHRKRLATTSTSFPKRNIRRTEPTIQDVIRNFLDRLDMHASSGIPTKTNLLFKAAASNVITEYAFQQSWNNVEKTISMSCFSFRHTKTVLFEFLISMARSGLHGDARGTRHVAKSPRRK